MALQDLHRVEGIVHGQEAKAWQAKVTAHCRVWHLVRTGEGRWVWVFTCHGC